MHSTWPLKGRASSSSESESESNVVVFFFCSNQQAWYRTTLSWRPTAERARTSSTASLLDTLIAYSWSSIRWRAAMTVENPPRPTTRRGPKKSRPRRDDSSSSSSGSGGRLGHVFVSSARRGAGGCTESHRVAPPCCCRGCCAGVSRSARARPSTATRRLILLQFELPRRGHLVRPPRGMRGERRERPPVRGIPPSSVNERPSKNDR
mmetsp:Transcript_195/g.718  ORF Transcript_195/g.718 Transcript_195/m.718 type:complete len:207 (-) Transcript_195:30-650(-)